MPPDDGPQLLEDHGAGVDHLDAIAALDAEDEVPVAVGGDAIAAGGLQQRRGAAAGRTVRRRGVRVVGVEARGRACTGTRAGMRSTHYGLESLFWRVLSTVILGQM